MYIVTVSGYLNDDYDVLLSVRFLQVLWLATCTYDVWNTCIVYTYDVWRNCTICVLLVLAVCRPPTCLKSGYQYDVFLSAWCPPTCVVPAYLYKMCKSALYLLNCMIFAFLYEVFLLVCLPACKMPVYMFDIFWPVRCSLTVRWLPTCLMSSVLTYRCSLPVWCLPICWCLDAWMKSAYLADTWLPVPVMSGCL
jgi:hypothetical protein